MKKTNNEIKNAKKCIFESQLLAIEMAVAQFEDIDRMHYLLKRKFGLIMEFAKDTTSTYDDFLFMLDINQGFEKKLIANIFIELASYLQQEAELYVKDAAEIKASQMLEIMANDEIQVMLESNEISMN
jgi:hypothetical protein